MRTKNPGSIRSYVLRQGRQSEQQANTIERYWAIYGLDCESGLQDWASLFGNDAPVVLDIGFGMGQALVAQAKSHPNLNFLGVEVHRPGVAKLLSDLANAELTNVRIFYADVQTVLAKCIPEHSLYKAQLFFPDPWPKTRHHKRRLLQERFINQLSMKLCSGGLLHVATDWQYYAQSLLRLLDSLPTWSNTQPNGGYIPRPESRPMTKFEQRGLALGHTIFDMIYYSHLEKNG